MNSITSLTPAQLRQAADTQEKIQSLREQLNSLLGGGETPASFAAEAPERPRKRRMSVAGRARIAAAARARWAKFRAEKGGADVVRKPKRKRKMTAAWKKSLSLARKARWAKAKKSGL
jgi:hypothetical protein